MHAPSCFSKYPDEVLLAGLFDESNGNEDPLPQEDEQQDDDDLHDGQDNH